MSENQRFCELASSPAFLHTMAQTNLVAQMGAFDEENHLKEREKQYCEMNLKAHGIFVIWETAEGWWRESIAFKDDVAKQIEKLKADPAVACAWMNQPRFDEPGGWCDPS